MADTNRPANGNDPKPDPAEKIAGNPNAGSRTPDGGQVPQNPGATPEAQGGKPTEAPNDPHAAATPAASAPPPPGPAMSEQDARIAEMKAKIEAAKAQKAGGAAPTAAASAPAASAPAGDSAKAAEMKAKIEALKAQKGETATAAVGTAPTKATAPATAATATATAERSPEQAERLNAVRSKIAETQETVDKVTAVAAKAAAPKPVPSGPTKPPKGEEVGVWYFGRRNFMQSLGWMSFFGFITIAILGTLRAMFPRVIYEKPPIFKAGFPGDYVPGSVSEKYKDEERVWIVRQGDGSFIALLAICTHLGCTPRWLAAENKFKCPCHGSGFRGTPNFGVNFEGPAPRPLERVAIKLAPDGQIEVDKSKKFLWEKGQWEETEAVLKV